MCVCVRSAFSLEQSELHSLMTESEGRRVRRGKTGADRTASWHVFQTDNCTGNWTKAYSSGYVLMCLGVCCGIVGLLHRLYVKMDRMKAP